MLLAAFVLTGRGLGASSAFASMSASPVHAVSPATAADNFYVSRSLADGAPPWRDSLVFEIAGVVIGALASARLAKRIARTVERGRGLAPLARFC